MRPQPTYGDGGWQSPSRFVWEPHEKILHGHIKVISTLRDLEKVLTETFGEDVEVNWPLIAAGLRNRGLA